MRECTDWRKNRQYGSKAFLIIAGARGVPFLFVKNSVLGREELAPGPNEASKRIFRRANEGLAALVKTRIHKHWTAGFAQGESLI